MAKKSFSRIKLFMLSAAMANLVPHLLLSSGIEGLSNISIFLAQAITASQAYSTAFKKIFFSVKPSFGDSDLSFSDIITSSSELELLEFELELSVLFFNRKIISN